MSAARRRDRGDQAGNASPSRRRGRGNRGQRGQQPQGGRRRGNPRRRNRPDRDRQDPVAFWGDPANLPPPQAGVRITDDPSAVPRSLGAPPLPGHEKVAEHYFRVVFERAVGTAGALAAAGGLIDPDALVDDEDDA
jgi:hypothetical protein